MTGAAAGWDENSTIDSKGIAILQLWLSDDPLHRFQPFLQTKDTEPNYDGYITYGEPKGRKVSPIGRANVQVKSTSSSLENNNTVGTSSQYKYECDTEVLFAALQKVSQDPTGLVIVDTCKKKPYWISLTQEYLRDLDLKLGQKSKTLYFNDAEEMSDYDRFFDLLNDLRATHLEFRKVMTDNALLVSSSVSHDRMVELQNVSDILEERCRTDLFFLKNCTFPTAWKMAIRYAERNGKAYLGIVPLIRGTNNSVLLGDLNLREEVTNPFYSGPLTQSYEEDPFLTVYCDEGKDLVHLLDDVFSKWGRKLETTLMIPPVMMPDIMLEELFFWYADMLAILIPGLGADARPSLYPSDSFTPSQCRRLLEAPYYAAWQHWMDYAQYVDFNSGATFVANPFSEDPTLNNFEKSSCCIQEFLKNQSLALENDFKIELSESDIPFRYIEQLVQEVEKREITLCRPWKLSFPERRQQSNSVSGGFRFFDDRGCTLEDYEANLVKLYSSYTELRETLLRQFFGSYFPFNDLIFLKRISIYFDKTGYGEITELYSGQGIGATFNIKPFSEYDQNWHLRFSEGDARSNKPEIMEGNVLAPFFTNAIPLYNLMEEDIIGVLRQLFPEERFSFSRRRDRYRFKKASSLSASRILLMR